MKRKPAPGLAKAAFEAWHKSFPAGTISYPDWSDISEVQQLAWVAAALSVYDLCSTQDSRRLDWISQGHHINTDKVRVHVGMAFDLRPKAKEELRRAIDEAMKVGPS